MNIWNVCKLRRDCEFADLHCPTTLNCNNCTINCNGRKTCANGGIFGHSCNNLIINCNSTDGENDAVKDTNIYAPNMFGNLTLNTLRGPKCFKETIVNSQYQTGFIKVYCDYNDPSDERECDQLLIDGINATNVEFQCINGADCQSARIYCPSNDYTIDGHWGTSCMFTYIILI